MESGQCVQGGLVQLAPSHQIAGNQGSHLWKEATGALGQGDPQSPGVCTASHHPLPPCHLSIHFVPFADFKKRFHGFQGHRVPLVDVLGGELKEEVPEVPDQGLRVPLWIELPGEVTGWLGMLRQGGQV